MMPAATIAPVLAAFDAYDHLTDESRTAIRRRNAFTLLRRLDPAAA